MPFEIEIVNKLNKLEYLNKTLKSPPDELGGTFLPENHKKQLDFMFVAEMPSMNEPKNKTSENKNFNFGVTKRDRFFQEMMIKYGVAGSYVTDIVKERDIARRPTKEEILKWLPFLIQEINIIQPKAVIVIGKTNYDKNFKPFIESLISKEIKVDWIFHYKQQGAKTDIEIEQRFNEVIGKMRNNGR